MFNRVLYFPDSFQEGEKERLGVKAKEQNEELYLLGGHLGLYIKELAYLRLVLPDWDVCSFLTPEEVKAVRKELRRLAHPPTEKDSTVEHLLHYVELAWAATILSAETVRITPDGRIEHEMPKKVLKSTSALPERPLV